VKDELLLASTMLGLALTSGQAQPIQATPAQTQPAQTQPARSCFYINQFQGWKAPDAKTIIIRVNLHDYYRLDLSAECHLLVVPTSHLITHTRGPDTVCSAIDWYLSVAESGMGSIPEPCIVKTMTPLTPADVAALPPKFRP
jgi:hypothetical protein